MTLEELTRQALRIHDLYDELNRRERGRVWTREEFMLGFVGDVGDLAKLVMREEGAREVTGGRAALEHELADCLWSVLVLAHHYDVDLEEAFGRTMTELDTSIRARLPDPTDAARPGPSADGRARRTGTVRENPASHPGPAGAAAAGHWTKAEPPAVSRTVLAGQPGALLDQADQDALSIDRMLHDPATGNRMAHRVLIPMATAADVPTLAAQPDAEIGDLYQQLADAGFALSVTEHVTARTPYPDEQTSLGLPDAGPLLIAYRITADADTGRPLLCEEWKAPAATCQLTYPVTPTKPATKRTRRPPESE
ncbi:MazG nucleotide pyrophosphohydrolase domain-containing protein [Streptomyces sp. NPDC002519]